MSNAWVVRPKPHNINRIDEFKLNNIIAIGWPCIGNLSNQNRSNLKNLLQQAPYNLTGRKLGYDYGILDMFINQMDLDDLVFIPDGNDIYLGKIVGPYSYDISKDNNIDGYPHQRKIQLLNKPLPRSTFSDTLKKCLKNRKTISKIKY